MMCPLDDRYAKEVTDLPDGDSRIRFQMTVEAKWCQAVCQLLGRPDPIESLEISEEMMEFFRETERRIGHDVKAMEITVAKFLIKEEAQELVHWGLTSEDINGCGNGHILAACRETLVQELNSICRLLRDLAKKCDYPVAARTHGQMAIPTSFKERLMAYHKELYDMLLKIAFTKIPIKFGGAIGNFDEAITALALHLDIPREKAQEKMEELADNFISSLGIETEKDEDGDEIWMDIYSGMKQMSAKSSPIFYRASGFQTAFYTDLALYLSRWQVLSGFLIKIGYDLWDAFSRGYFILKTDGNRVGSSVMSQKINPADTECGIGNWKTARGMLENLIRELPTFRLERDITDSTQLRNLPMIFGYLLLGFRKWKKDLTAMEPSELQKSGAEVEQNAQLYIARVQTYLRLQGVQDVYERTRKLTQGQTFTKDGLCMTLEKEFPETSGKTFGKLLDC